MTTDTLIQRVVEFTTPSQCMVCTTEGTVLCASCRASALEFMAPEHAPAPLRSWEVVTTYDDIGKELLRRFKFEGDQEAGRLCASYMRELVDASQIDVVVAVTTTPARRRQRGYDQAALLAREVARHLHLPYARALVRIKNVHQIGMDRATRLEQSSGLYAATKVADIRGRRILLVDDVVTTGATMTSAATTLLQAGAREVHGLAFARDRLAH